MAILGRSPVLQLFSRRAVEKSANIQWGKNEKRSFCV